MASALHISMQPESQRWLPRWECIDLESFSRAFDAKHQRELDDALLFHPEWRTGHIGGHNDALEEEIQKRT